MNKIFFTLAFFISTHTFSQELTCNNAEIKAAFTLAVQTVDINTRRGILAAGGDYGGEWTRDIAINSWNGVSLFRPKIAEQSLWSVTLHKDTIGHQYWDKIIWTIAAYNHYLITGDKIFLKQAYTCSANTMKALEQVTFDATYGLFMGPSVFNDGIAGYPEPIYEPTNFSSYVLDHKNSLKIKCLSTNCIYYGAYLALTKMSVILNTAKDVTVLYKKKADDLKQSIVKNFYDVENSRFNYLIDQHGKVDKSQEALGISFAIIFGILEGAKAKYVIDNATVSNYGITSVYPNFPRYSTEKPGRHNAIIWPMVNGFFANAARISMAYKPFDFELKSLTHLALDADKGDYNFREIYNPYTGKPDGGFQAWGEERPNFHWESCKFQTWSATAYISMVVNGVLGLKFNETTLSIEPFLPPGLNYIELKNVAYRQSILTIAIKGHGASIKKFIVDGKEQQAHSISSTLNGVHNIVIEVDGEM